MNIVFESLSTGLTQIKILYIEGKTVLLTYIYKIHIKLIISIGRIFINILIQLNIIKPGRVMYYYVT